MSGLENKAGPFGDVQCDGGRGAAQLVTEARVTNGKRCDDPLRERDEVHGRDVDVEFFVVELHEEDVGRRDSTLRR